MFRKAKKLRKVNKIVLVSFQNPSPKKGSFTSPPIIHHIIHAIKNHTSASCFRLIKEVDTYLEYKRKAKISDKR
jgi:hypothetical protein